MNTIQQTWIHLPPARRGAKCPVSGWSRRKVQQLIYGVPQQGIPPKVRYKHVTGQGRGDQGVTYVHVPSLMAHMLGTPEIDESDLTALHILSQSPAFCQSAFKTLLDLMNDRAGLTCTEYLTYLKATCHELRNTSRTDSASAANPDLPDDRPGIRRMGAA